MNNLFPSWVRVPVFLLLVAGVVEYLVDSKGQLALLAYPVLQLVLLVVLLMLIAGEITLSALHNILFKSLSPEARERYLEQQLKRNHRYSWISIYRRVSGTAEKPNERDLELDHNYDGIKELDNTLPGWWLYSFYLSIVFAAGYLVYYHLLGGPTQLHELEQELAAAKIAVEQYKKNAPDLVHADNVERLTDPAALEAGKALFNTNCMACHATDGGGGIGPNLTDEYWILGGGIKNIFQTISDGGRDGKGMVAWKSTLRPTEVQQVASYIMSLQGTIPANPKEPQGEIWELQ